MGRRLIVLLLVLMTATVAAQAAFDSAGKAHMDWLFLGTALLFCVVPVWGLVFVVLQAGRRGAAGNARPWNHPEHLCSFKELGGLVAIGLVAVVTAVWLSGRVLPIFEEVALGRVVVDTGHELEVVWTHRGESHRRSFDAAVIEARVRMAPAPPPVSVCLPDGDDARAFLSLGYKPCSAPGWASVTAIMLGVGLSGLALGRAWRRRIDKQREALVD